MVYLYAALGITMLTGVITMFEISSALINQQVLNSAPIDTYVQTIYQTNDRNFLRVLTHADSSWGSGDTLCTNLKLKATELEEDLLSVTEYSKGAPNSSSNLRLMGSCILSKDDHRILITPITESNATSSLFSCIIKDDIICDFEE